MKKECLYYQKLNDKVKCNLCPHNCTIAEGKTGICRARKNENGTLYSLIYGECSSIALDPIEKKPLFHFYPGTYILSLGTLGCNFTCIFCQNWHISQSTVPTQFCDPEKVVRQAKANPVNIGIAYTYNEPLIWYEYVLETAKLAHQEGLKNVLVTNGYINEEPLRNLLPFIDAMNIDLKAIRDEFYRKVCKGRLEPVLNTIKIAKQFCFIELTNLIVPGLNDTEDELQELVDWVANLDPEIPLHFSRYFPNYQLNTPPTPIQTLRKAYEIASRKLKYVYLGNVIGESENTICPNCKKDVIIRHGYTILRLEIKNGKCNFCSEEINIVGA